MSYILVFFKKDPTIYIQNDTQNKIKEGKKACIRDEGSGKWKSNGEVIYRGTLEKCEKKKEKYFAGATLLAACEENDYVLAKQKKTKQGIMKLNKCFFDQFNLILSFVRNRFNTT
jgi:hypothetical protein